MAEMTHLVKAVSTEVLINPGETDPWAWEEVGAYTITWENLTAANFGAGDDIAIVVKVGTGGGSANNPYNFIVGFGTTYAGRTDEALSETQYHPPDSGVYHDCPYQWIDRRTLTTGEDIYFSAHRDGAGTLRLHDFVCMVFKLDDLGANDFLYNETTPSGNAPVTYTDGASVTTAAAGDWFFVGMVRWVLDDATSNVLSVIDVDGVEYSEYDREAEDATETWNIATTTYQEALATSKVAKVKYRVDVTTTHDVTRTAILGLRLDAFKDHYGDTTSATTLPTQGTFTQVAEVPTYAPSQTGDVCIWGLSINQGSGGSARQLGRIWMDGADWPSSFDTSTYRCHGDSTEQPVHIINLASVSTGTKDFDFWMNPVYIASGTTSEQAIFVAFSMELAAVGGIIQQITHHRKMIGVS